MAEFTGRKMLAVTLGAFGVVVAVNGVLAWQAVATFPGLEVQNGYVASQTWDAERAAQAALGWRLAVDYDPGRGRLRLAFTDRDGRPAPVEALAVLVGRPTAAREDLHPPMAQVGGAFDASVTLAPGKWMVKVEALAPDGTLFRQRHNLHVAG